MKMQFRSVLLLTIIFSIFGMISTSSAQESGGIGVVADDPGRFGLDPETFLRFFAKVGQTSGPNVDDVRDSIDSFRIWFDEELVEEGFARAEIKAERQAESRQLVITFEKEPVVFNDEGRDFDRERGDGLFTAAVPLRLPGFMAEQAIDTRDLQETIEVLANFPQFQGREVVKDQGFAEMLELLRGDNEVTQRFNLIREFGGNFEQMAPREILDRLEINPERTPILEAIRRERIFDLHLFDIPLVIFGSVLPSDVDPDRSLMITDVNVVEDSARTFDVCTGAGTPGGPWTFAHLMREMAQGSGVSAEDFTMQWLNTWILPQEANGILVSDPGRAAQLQARIIDPWINASGGTPDIDLFPARLMAIVSRSDLADAGGYSQAGSGGEARFVFGLMENNGVNCNTIPFTVIFEYGINVNGCFDLKSWVQQWKDLDNFPIGSAAYNAALEAITRQFTDHGTNPSQLPNRNSLAQLRTNEIALGLEWELREFTLQGPASSTPGLLDLVTVKQTPDISLNGSGTLAAYIASDTADILAGNHIVPNTFPTLINPFLGATAPTPFDIFWDAPGVVGLPGGVDIRHNFSLATCSGCHMRETDTFFTHIGAGGQRSPGTPAALSGFLTGITVADPVDGTVMRNFNDLARRQQKVADVLNNTCFSLPFAFPTLKMVH